MWHCLLLSVIKAFGNIIKDKLSQLDIRFMIGEVWLLDYFIIVLVLMHYSGEYKNKRVFSQMLILLHTGTAQCFSPQITFSSARKGMSASYLVTSDINGSFKI